MSKARLRRLAIDGWRAEPVTSRGLPFVAERSLRTPRTVALPVHAPAYRRRQTGRTAGVLIGLAALLLCGAAWNALP